MLKEENAGKGNRKCWEGGRSAILNSVVIESFTENKTSSQRPGWVKFASRWILQGECSKRGKENSKYKGPKRTANAQPVLEEAKRQK